MVRRGRGSFHAATAGAVWVVGEGAVVETRVPGRRVDVPQRRSWALVVATSVVVVVVATATSAIGTLIVTGDLERRQKFRRAASLERRALLHGCYYQQCNALLFERRKERSLWRR